MKCETCRFWRANVLPAEAHEKWPAILKAEALEKGHCHLHPQPFPKDADGWCGQWHHIDAPPMPPLPAIRPSEEMLAGFQEFVAQAEKTKAEAREAMAAAVKRLDEAIEHREKAERILDTAAALLETSKEDE